MEINTNHWVLPVFEKCVVYMLNNLLQSYILFKNQNKNSNQQKKNPPKLYKYVMLHEVL